MAWPGCLPKVKTSKVGYQLTLEAEADVDGIWYYFTKSSDDAGVATRQLENLTEGFWLLSRFQQLGRRCMTAGTSKAS